MSRIALFKSSVAIAALLALPLAQAAGIGKTEYKAIKVQIDATYRADKAACASLAGNAKDVCIEKAKGKEAVARAELEYNDTGKAADRNKVWTTQADANYAVAKELCDDFAGNPKDVCVQEAKAAHTKAMVDARVGRVVAEARSDANRDKLDADFKVAAERCDALSGEEDMKFKRPFPSPWHPEHGTRWHPTRVGRSSQGAESG